MPLSPLAIKKLRDVQKTIRKTITAKTPYKFDMNDFLNIGNTQKGDAGLPLSHGFCATAGCICGTLLLQEGWLPRVTARDYGNGTIVNVDNSTYVKGKKELDVYDAARRELGVNINALESLFVPWSDRFESNPYWVNLDSSEPRDAITAINRFIKAGGRSPKTVYTL